MKINYYGKRSRFAILKYKLNQAFRLFVTVMFILGVLAVVFYIGAFTFSTNTTVVTKVMAEQIQTPVVYPVLNRIADCESGTGKKGTATQFRNGQVILHANKNGTTDIGKYQINMRVWGKKATKLGFNLATEAGNTKMAEWIYLNYGTGAWKYSSKCWR